MKISREEREWWTKRGITRESSHIDRLNVFEKEFIKFERKYKKYFNYDCYEKRFHESMSLLHSIKNFSESVGKDGTDSGSSQDFVKKSMSNSSSFIVSPSSDAKFYSELFIIKRIYDKLFTDSCVNKSFSIIEA